jgi:hypothetical protein
MIRESRGENIDVVSAAMRKRTSSASSLRPVGIDLSVEDGTDDAANEAIADRRRRLQRVVVAAVSVCGLILVAAAGTQVARASAGGANAVVAAKLAEPPPPAQAAAAPGAPASNGPAADAPAPTGVGKVRLRWPAIPGHVWLDGEKMISTWETVSCGKHEIRVGTHGHPHTIDVPCNDEVHVSR